jgi:O-antigen/teichoic acid export membrane protein
LRAPFARLTARSAPSGAEPEPAAVPGTALPVDRDPEIRLTAADVRRRATAGVGVIVTRGFTTIGLGLGANVVLARLLLPRDFGLVALGTSVMIFTNALSSAGLGAGLIRRSAVPDREELETLLGLQLAATAIAVVVAAIAATPFGEKGWVVIAMVASLPLSALKTPGVVLLERDLVYKRLMAIEILETIIYYAWALATVASGWGVWGLATAVVVRSAAGAAAIILRVPGGAVRPRLRGGHARDLVGFGVRVQATALIHTVRDQAIVVGTTAIAGLSIVGLWSLANRLLLPLFIVLSALWRVSYPAMSRLADAREDPGRLLERGLGPLSAGIGLLLVPLVASGPALVPTLFGARWTGATGVLPWAGAAIMVIAPISVAATGYLYSVGDTATILRLEILSAVLFCGLTLPLLPSYGLPALGVGWLVSAAAEAVILVRRMTQRTNARILSALWPASMSALVAGSAGWILASSLAPTMATAAEAIALSSATYLGALLLMSRTLVQNTAREFLHAAKSSLVGAR